MAGRCWITNCKIYGRLRSWRVWRSSTYFPDGNQKIHAITQDSCSPHWGSNTTFLRMKQGSEPPNLEIFYGRYWAFLLFLQHRFSFCIIYSFTLTSLICVFTPKLQLLLTYNSWSWTTTTKKSDIKEISHYMWQEYFITLQLPPLRPRYHARWYTGNASDLHP